MLTPLDDTLIHQAPTTFDHATTSDHRFFDRWAVGIQHRDVSVIYGVAFYKNTDVCDGFICVATGDRQFNLRATRPLRPVFEVSVGPLSFEITQPLHSHRLTTSADAPISCDLTWSSVLPAREEHAHFERRSGRVVRDYCRFDQLGRGDGWVRVGDSLLELHDAWAWRDHSWGVRPGMGGPDPVIGHPAADEPNHRPRGSIFIWLAFEAGPVAGQFQVTELADGTRLAVDGHVIPDTGEPSTTLHVVDVRHDVAFVGGHTCFESARLDVITDDGRTWVFQAQPVRPPWVFLGAGYSGGWEDGAGLGVARGHRTESDAYRYLGPADVELPDGSPSQPWHRETDVAITVDGLRGDGHLTIIARPPLPSPTITRGLGSP